MRLKNTFYSYRFGLYGKSVLVSSLLTPFSYYCSVFQQLWPANCFEHTSAPYKPQNLMYADKYSVETPNQVACVDRRTMSERTLDLYPEAREVLEWCLDNNIALTICSRSPDYTLVKEILKAFDMLDWFLLPQVYKKRKSYHFRNLTECTGLRLNDFLFFDDDKSNIEVCSAIGVASCKVDPSTGLNWATMIQGLHIFAAKHNQSEYMARSPPCFRTKHTIVSTEPSSSETKAEAAVVDGEEVAECSTLGSGGEHQHRDINSNKQNVSRVSSDESTDSPNYDEGQQQFPECGGVSAALPKGSSETHSAGSVWRLMNDNHPAMKLSIII